MNYKITHNWLLDYIDTDATAEEIQSYLSLSSVNVETLEYVGDDIVYDIEVTSNRIDVASVVGFALECVAVLPRYGKRAEWKSKPLGKHFDEISPSAPVKEIAISIQDDGIVSRFAAVILSDVKVGPSPDIIRTRLEACGEHSINNVVDISNYLRIALGQPVHMFDYDAIEKATMVIQKSLAGDVVVLIDGKELKLPGNDIIIKDGGDRIIDLVGLMGGQNTEIKDTTRNVLLFVPVVDKRLIRKTSMITNHRTAAISYFEKGLDEARVEPALVYGVELLREHAHATVASKVLDVYPEPADVLHVSGSKQYIETLMNTPLTVSEIREILSPLGFHVTGDADQLDVVVPSYRAKDIEGFADIAEEVARIYGYHNITPVIQQTNPVYQPLAMRQLVDAKDKIQDFLSACGFYEQYSYSMISKADIAKYGDTLEDYLKLSNTISADIEYLRTSLTPSLLKMIAENQGKREMLHFFELARVYIKRAGELPNEEERLCIVSHADFSILKGVLENIFNLLHIEQVSFRPTSSDRHLSTQAALIGNDGKQIGLIGILKDTYRLAFDIKKTVSIAEISLKDLIAHINYYPKYIRPNPFAHIKLDYTYTTDAEHIFADIRSKAFETSTMLQSVDLVSQFESNVTIRFVFAAPDRNITDAEAQAELKKIKAVL